MTLTSFAPRRSEVRQQSMAVLPTPMIRTRSPIFLDVLECNRFEPGDADMNAGCFHASHRQIQFLALRRTRTDEHRCEFIGIEQVPHAVDRGVELEVDTHVHDVADLFVEHVRREAEGRNVGAHQSDRPRQLFENRYFVPKGTGDRWQR